MDPRKPIFEALRAELKKLGRTLDQPIVTSGDAWLDSFGFPRAAAALGEPEWTRIGRTMLGLREIPGARHEPRIVRMWRKAPWFKTDETPWCGGYIFECMEQAGIISPRDYAKAAAWASWGVACPPQVGAIGVKARKGGNHVFQIVGQTANRIFYKALGGNQDDGVSIIDIRKSDTFAVRWPAGVAQTHLPLPIMAAGKIGAREA